MNPLKALYLQQRPEDEADMSSTLGTDPQEPKRKARCKIFFLPSSCCTVALLFGFLTGCCSCCSGSIPTAPVFLFFYSASSDDQSFNKVAERVLMRLQEKLKGVEEGTVLSVGGQVNLLIQQAMDPKNLSRLFPDGNPGCDLEGSSMLLEETYSFAESVSTFQIGISQLKLISGATMKPYTH